MTDLFNSVLKDKILNLDTMNNRLLNYIEILIYIVKFNSSKFYYNKGQINEESYTYKTTMYGGSIRNILYADDLDEETTNNSKQYINDIDLYIEATPKHHLSLNGFVSHLTKLNAYLDKSLPKNYKVEIQFYKCDCISKLIDVYGNYKIVVYDMGDKSKNNKYTFDITCNVNITDDKYENTNLFKNLADYTVNNLKIPLYVNKLNNTLLFGQLQIRCQKLTPYYSVQDIIQHIQSGITVQYNYKEFVDKYVKTLSKYNSKGSSTNSIDYYKYMNEKMKDRKDKIKCKFIII